MAYVVTIALSVFAFGVALPYAIMQSLKAGHEAQYEEEKIGERE